MKKVQDDIKELLGNEYEDYDLVVALASGRPCKNIIIENAFIKLREEAGLSNVVFDIQVQPTSSNSTTVILKRLKAIPDTLKSR